MQTVYALPVSRPGEFLCEIANASKVKTRFVTSRHAEMARLERRGAVVFVSRAGGWVRKD